MEKLDLKKKFKNLYLPSAKEVVVVDVPEFQFVMIDGDIEAGESPSTSQSYQDAIGALYGAAYTLKFKSKLREVNPIDFTVMALEGLWWTEGEEFDFDDKDNWQWTMMIMQPDHITQEMFSEALEEAKKKKDNPALDKLRLERFHEGLSMQIMHIGPYADEPRTLAKMAAFAEENGYQPRGLHHEIYLGDPRRAKPENLKTVLRQPVHKLD
ncbi:MAG: GyrI-like domain-containing protein [Anaerolineales bacterium]|jgi:hypothetical protein